ncbi:esterase-like activity of phytase family protein [Pseudoduganella buxea]|uniref:3-phytase n=1 Tax=Pseudoduganella buxea TaxID=1949069 RepID=A0A6I3T3P6_9BURK|nr:esterase-like activity of phytase family protein [Pseudoduganella buxea]MTV55102.1 esterase-like activity of phytase family protein [Pseudoduganella buxea]GGB88037.1 3-phytase [Pseudoduganella buxea]
MKSLSTLVSTLVMAGLLGACATASEPVLQGISPKVTSLRFIGEQRIGLKQPFAGTPVGGLSGIDYDAGDATWVLLSDDRSNLEPARFYRARGTLEGGAFTALTLTQMGVLLQQDGTPHPDLKAFAKSGGTVLDPESVRVDPRDGSIWYTSEGDLRIGMEPAVRHAAADGSFLGSLPLPPMLRLSRDDKTGARNNLNLEGLCFAADGDSLWLALEAPLVQDGPVPTPATGALSRISRLDRDGRLLAQYAYPVDPIPSAPGAGKLAENGISEILASGEHTLLVLERAAVQGDDGKYRNHIRLYEMDVRGATDVARIPALLGAAIAPARKRLVLDLNTLHLPVLDNLEGIGWGPRLPNGHATLAFISDDNFNPAEVTQLLLFEVL